MAAEEGAAARDTARPFPVDDTRALAEELESLGGAEDVAVGVASVYCSVCPAAARAAALSRTAARPRREVVRAVDGLPTESASRFVLEVDDPEPPTRGRAGTDGDAGVGRNDANPSSANDDAEKKRVVDERRRTRRYRVDGVASSGGVPDTMWRDVADWLHRGFDAVVVAHGQSGSGKTRALFGDGGGASERDRPGLVSRVVRALFARRDRNEDTLPHATPSHGGSRADMRFAVSAWELLPSGDAVDLLDPSGSGKGFAVSGSGSHGGAGDRFGAGDRLSRVRCVEVRDAEACEAALTLARRASKNWTVPARANARAPTEGFAGAAATPRPGRAHAFFRLACVSAETSDVVAELHVVDLIGAGSLELHESASDDDDEPHGPVEEHRAGLSREKQSRKTDDRRAVARQLLAFGRVVDELASRETVACVSTGDTHVATESRTVSTIAVAARESRLTQILAPLLAAGARLFFLACVSPLDVDRLDTLETMRVAQRAARLRSACVRRRMAAPEHAEGLDGSRAKPARLESLRDVLAERARADARTGASRVPREDASRNDDENSQNRPFSATSVSGRTDRGSRFAETRDTDGASTRAKRVLSPNRPARLPASLTTRRGAPGSTRLVWEPVSRAAAPGGSPKGSPKGSPPRDAVEAYLRLHERATLDALASNSLRDFESDADASAAFGAGDGAADAPTRTARTETDAHAMDDRVAAEGGVFSRFDADDAPRASNSDAHGSFVPEPRSRDRSPPDPTPLTRRASLRAEFSHLYASVAAGEAAGTRGAKEAEKTNAANDAENAENAENASRVDAYDEYFAVKNEPLVAVLGVSDVSGDGARDAEVPLGEKPSPLEPFDRASDARLGAHELRRRLDALAATLGAERRARLACEEKLNAAKLDCETRVLEARASEDASRLEAAELRRRRDLLLENSPEALAEVFARYERDVTAAERECARLRRENLDLAVEASNGARSAGDPYFPASGNPPGWARGSTGEAVGPEAGIAAALASRDVQRRLDRLSAALRKSEDARAREASENAELRRRERVTATRARAFDDAAKRVRVLETQNRDVAEATRLAHLATARADALRHAAEEHANELHDESRDLREALDRAAAETHRANARCHELEASFLERRAATSGDSLAARDAALASARAAVDVPDQPSVLRMAAELRSAAKRAARAGDAENALAALFDAFVEDIERGFETSRASSRGSRKENNEEFSAASLGENGRDATHNPGPAASRGGEASNDGGRPDDAGLREDAGFREDAPRELHGSERGPNAVARGALRAPRNHSPPKPRKEDPSADAADAIVERRSDRPSNVDSDADADADADPEPVFGFGGPTSASSAFGAAERGKRKVTAVSKKLTLRAPPPDVAAAAAAAAAARGALAPRAPFATDETYDFLFDRGTPTAVPLERTAVASFDSSRARRSGNAPYLPAPLTPRRRSVSPVSPRGDAERPERPERRSRRESETFSPPEARATSSVGALTRFRVGRSPSPPSRRRPDEAHAFASPSSLARSPPGSPRAFVPAGRRGA